MTPSQALRRRAEELFQELADLPTGERGKLLEERCGSDQSLRDEVASLLRCLDEGRIISLADVEAREESDADLVGQSIGPYRLLELIGEGGFGSVYMAEQRDPIHRHVAVKLIKLGMDTKQVIARFEAERQALALMDHPNIAQVYEAGATENGRPFFAMELVHGVKILDYCDDHQLTTPERLGILVQVCRGVQHAHQKGIIHRDLKPSNVLVTIRDGAPMPKIIDFGIAKATSDRLTEKTLFTGFRQFIGTPEYMSPEQAEMSPQDVDTRSDVYSLGVLLYELLTGTTPFDAQTLRSASFAEVQRMIREDDPPTPSQRVSRLGSDLERVARARRAEPQLLPRLLRGDLDWIVMKSLEKDRARRYDTAADLAADIERHLNHEPVQASPPSTAYRFRKFVRRNRAAVTAGVLVALALTVGCTLATIGLVRAQAAARRAEREAEAAQAINTFFTDMLVAADPMQMRLLSAFSADDPMPGGPPTVFARDVSVAEMVKRAGANVSAAFAGKPELEATARETLGMTLWGLGQLNEARPHLEAALEIRKRIFPADHAETLRSSLALGSLLSEAGRYAEAESLVRSTWEAMKRVYGPTQARTLSCATVLASTLAAQEKFTEADEIFGDTLELQRTVLGPEHRDTLTTMMSWSDAYLGRGDVPTGAPLARAVYDIGLRNLGPNDSITMRSGAFVGWWHLWEGQYAQAEALLRPCLESCRRVLGEGHPFSCMTTVALGMSLQESADQEEKEELLRSALNGLTQAVGDAQMSSMYVMNLLSRCLYRRGKFAEAEDIHHRWLDAARTASGPAASYTWFASDRLASFYEDIGRPSDALAVYRDWLAAARQCHGPRARETIWAMSSLDKALWRLGRPAEATSAVGEIRSTVQSMAEAKDVAPGDLAAAAEALLTCQPPELRDPATALTLAERAVALGGPDDPKLLQPLALAYARTGDLPRAETFQREAIELLKDEHSERVLAAANLAQWLAEAGQEEAATRVRDEMVAAYLEAIGEGNAAQARFVLSMAASLQHRDHFAAAEALLRSITPEGEAAAAEASDDLQTSRLDRLAACCYQQGRYREAVDYYQDALASAQRVFGDADMITLGVRQGLAMALYRGGDPAAAMPHQRAILDLCRQLGAEQTPVAQGVTNDLSAVLLELGELDEARELAEAALVHAQRLYGEESLRVAQALRVLGGQRLAQGALHEAEPLLRKSVALFERVDVGAAERWLRAESESTLGECLTAQGQFAEAETVLLGSVETLRAEHRVTSHVMDLTRERLAALYAAWDRPQDAERWRAEAAGGE